MVVVTAGLLVAGCAQTSAESGSAAAGASPTSVSSSPPTSGAPSTSGPGQAPTGNQVVIRGTVRRGVETGCVLLDGQDKRVYLLLGGDRSQLRAGTRVEVTGEQVDQMASTCGEGIALSVKSVQPLG